MMLSKYICVILLLSTFYFAHGQASTPQSPYHQTFLPTTSSSNPVNSAKPVTAVAIKSMAEQIFTLQLGSETLRIPRDPDAEAYTYFISLPQPATNFTIASEGSAYQLHLIHSGEAPGKVTEKARVLEGHGCLEPLLAIPQEEWRAGLPEPEYVRAFHEINHNIVHHAAGSNTNSNYTQVVRDIYLYHTEVNGWSDIGYNYLIGQDGTIYAGRDPGEGSQDQVQGAHFCGRNAGTLGICLLGNYETAMLSDPASEGLNTVLTYQILLQDHDPFDTFNHPLGRIGSIAGHRDGCATLCPGANVYEMLPQIRNQVAQQVDACRPPMPLAVSADTTLVKVGQQVFFTASGDFDEYFWTIEGAFPRQPTGATVSVSFGIPGKYDVQIIAVKQQDQDTLFLADFVTVSRFTDRPIVFPNPIVPGEPLTIDSKEELLEISIYHVSGSHVLSINENTIDVASLSSGLYLIEIRSTKNIYKERLVIP